MASMQSRLKEIEEKIGPLTPGKGYGGPEYAGCINSGHRPIIRRVHDQNLGRVVIIVGPQSYAQQLSREAMSAIIEGKRFCGTGNSRIYFFRSRKPAMQKFLALCEVVLKFNDGVRRDTADARRKLSSKDPSKMVEGAFALRDLGGL